MSVTVIKLSYWEEKNPLPVSSLNLLYVSWLYAGLGQPRRLGACSVPFLLPILGHQHSKRTTYGGEKGGKRLGLLELSMREKNGTNVNFLERSFSSPKFYFSPALMDSLGFWWVKGSENTELSQASDSNYPDTNRGLVQLLYSPPYLDSVKKWWKSHWPWVCTTKIFHKHHVSTNKWATMKRAKIKALTVNVQISSCLNMSYENLWC